MIPQPKCFCTKNKSLNARQSIKKVTLILVSMESPSAQNKPHTLQEVAAYCLAHKLLAEQHQAAARRVSRQKQLLKHLEADFFGKKEISS